MLYFAAGIGFLDSTTTTVMRSMIISVVPVTEIGKVFCVVEFFKGILALTGPLIYGYLYEKTLRTVPEAFLYLSSACKCIVFIVGIIIYIELTKRETRKKREKYSHKKDDVHVLNDELTESDTTMKENVFGIEDRITPLPTYEAVENRITEEIEMESYSPDKPDCQIIHQHFHSKEQKNTDNQQ